MFDSATLTLDVKSVLLFSRFGTTYGQLHSGKWGFNIKVALPRRHSLVLGSGEAFEEMELSVSLRETAPEFVEWGAERCKELLGADQIVGLVRYGAARPVRSYGTPILMLRSFSRFGRPQRSSLRWSDSLRTGATSLA